MLDENRNVTEASFEVGYESVSQFTRDYRKMFGLTPKEDILKLRSQKKGIGNFFVEMGKLYSITPVKIRIYLN